MPVAAFDTHAAVKHLQQAGAEERLAEAVVATLAVAVGETVTKADLEPLATKAETKADIAELRAEIAGEFKGLYRHLWVMAAGIVGVTVALVKLIP